VLMSDDYVYVHRCMYVCYTQVCARIFRCVNEYVYGCARVCGYACMCVCV